MAKQNGIGKTTFVEELLAAVATGTGFLGFAASGKPTSVLYVDGELPAHYAKNLLERLIVRSPEPEPLATNFHYIGPNDVKDGLMPDISTEDGQKTIDAWVNETEAKIVCFDALQTLSRSGDPNGVEGFRPVQGTVRGKLLEAKVAVT